MTSEEKYEYNMNLIKDTAFYLSELAINGDIEKLNLYRIFLNEKVMECVKLKRKINDNKK
jgi:hypothetical protein